MLTYDDRRGSLRNHRSSASPFPGGLFSGGLNRERMTSTGQRNPTPKSINPRSYTLHPRHATHTLHPTPYTLHPNGSTLDAEARDSSRGVSNGRGSPRRVRASQNSLARICHKSFLPHIFILKNNRLGIGATGSLAHRPCVFKYGPGVFSRGMHFH